MRADPDQHDACTAGSGSATDRCPQAGRRQRQCEAVRRRDAPPSSFRMLPAPPRAHRRRRDCARPRRGRHRGASGVISAPDRGACAAPARAADGDLRALPRRRRHDARPGLAIHFPAPNSYTGEAVLELQAHGGPVLLQLLLARCLEAMPGLRLAGPGEFTERAFLNGKLDLAQAEAVSDLIEASTEQAARSAGARWPARSPGRSTRCATGWSSCACWSRRRSTFPRRRSTSSNAPMPRAAGAHRRRARRRAGSRASGALLREACAWCWRAAQRRQRLAAQRAGRRRAGHRHADPGHDARQGQQTIQIHGVPVHVTDTAGLRDPRPRPTKSSASASRAAGPRSGAGRRRAVPARPVAPGRA